MAYFNGRSYTNYRGINLTADNGCVRFVTPTTTPTATSGERLMYVNSSNQLIFSDGSTDTTLGSAGGVSNFSLNDAYDDGFAITVDGSAVTLNASHATNNAFNVRYVGSGTGNMIDIQNDSSGTDGFDIQGTDNLWSVSSAGALLVASIADVTTNATLQVDGDGTGGVTIGGVSTGIVTITPASTLTGAVTATASVTITGTAGTDVFTVTAGDLVVSDGSLTMTDADNANTVAITNNTISSSSLIAATANGITSGDFLLFTTTDAGFSGNYLRFNDGADVFTVGDEGAVTIAGGGGTNVLTLTAGDAVLSDGSVTLTDADNAATLSLLNDTASTIGASADAGVVQIDSASLTTGRLLNLTLSEGSLAGGSYLRCYDQTGAEAVFDVGENGLTTILGSASGTDALVLTAGDILLTSGALDMTVGDLTLADGSVVLTDADNAASLSATNSTASTVGAAADTGIAHLSSASLTTGRLLNLSLSEGSLNGGSYLRCYDQTATATVFSVGEDGLTTITGSASGTDALVLTAGDILLTSGAFDMTVGDMTLADGSITITDADNAASFSLTNNTATTIGAAADSGVALLTSASLTTGRLLELSLSEGSLNGGSYLRCYDQTATAAVFTIAEDGATTVAGSAADTAALTLTAGDIVVSSGDINVSIGNVTVADTADNYVLDVTGNASAATQAAVRFTQDHLTGAVPVLELDQDDTDVAFVRFTGTAGSGSSLDTRTTSGANTHHIKVTINGTDAWIPASTNAPS